MGFCIRWAYGLQMYQPYETVGPDWIEPGPNCVRYDILAKAGQPVSVTELRSMLGRLLSERLKVTLHRETRVMDVYVLRIAKDGPKFHNSEKQEEVLGNRGSTLEFQRAPIARLTETMTQFLPQLIVDETGLDGGYDFTVDLFKYQESYPPMRADGGRADWGSAISRALKDIGLELQQKRRPVEVLVIDHAEKTPVEN